MREEEFSEIVATTKGSVLAAIGATLSPHLRDHIDDVVQETYLQAFRRIKKGGKESIQSQRNYLYTIAKNESMRWNKREKKMIQIQEQLFTEHSEVAEAESIAEYLEPLPLRYQKAVTLILEGFSVRETANTLGVSEGAIKTQMFRARKLMSQARKKEEKQ